MSNLVQCLLIGGPAHGTVVMVPENTFHYLFMGPTNGFAETPRYMYDIKGWVSDENYYKVAICAATGEQRKQIPELLQLRKVKPFKVQSPSPSPAADTNDFIVRTNKDYAAWCKTFYEPGALDSHGRQSLHGLWAWQEQERRLEVKVKDLEQRLALQEAALLEAFTVLAKHDPKGAMTVKPLA